MILSAEKYILLLTVFGVVFGTTLYVQGRILSRKILGYYSDASVKSGKLIDILVVIAVTGVLAYILVR